MIGIGRLPLGLDLGSTRVRLARSERAASGEVRLAAIASRDLPEDAATAVSVPEPELVAAIIEDLRHEVGAGERRCVLSMNAQVASLRLVRFPKMNSVERRQAARFEADRFATWDTKSVPSIVRVHPVHPVEHVHAVGVVREPSLVMRIACAKNSGLRPIGVDHDACALQRAFPFCDAVLDVGYRQATLHAFTPTGPLSLCVPGGGAEITRAIGADLAIDALAAEKRKRVLGTAGAGEGACDTFASLVNAAVVKARERTPLRRIAVVGNGSRLPGLSSALEAVTGSAIEMPISDVLRGDAYPEDVIRAAAPDWTLAACLATWGAAR
ncbi:MAG: pilus assembly protein PilM [Candidatus Tumulicola sp.]